MKSLILGTACAVALSLTMPGASAAEGSGIARYEPWGFDLTAMDRSVRPGDDFDRYASGAWAARTPFPNDQTGVGSFIDVGNLSLDQLHAIYDGAEPDSPIGKVYRSFMNETRLETLDSAPLTADLAAIAATRDKTQFAELNSLPRSPFAHPLFDLAISADVRHPTVNSVYLGQGDLALSDRDYYLKASFKTQLAAYRAYIERALASVGYRDSARHADQIIAFETQMARLSWSRTDRRDIDKTINPMTLPQLSADAPGFPWKRFIAASGIDDPGTLIVGETTAIRGIARLYQTTSLDTLKAWATFYTIYNASPYLSKRFVDSRFEFTRVIDGSKELRSRWKRASRLLNASLGELVGKTYVERYFPAAAKAEMLRMIDALKTSMGQHIRGTEWMDSATKTEALAKLAALQVFIGYPDKWRDYSALGLDADDLYGNARRSLIFEWRHGLADLGQPVDRSRWGMTPQTVNASANLVEVKLTFPAGILQPPLFNLKADAAVNYGAAGSIIGHEISHLFDDQGRKVDSTGTLRDWWTARDAELFKQQAATLGRQYDAFEPFPGVHLNGSLTMGENIADLAGVKIAYDAYHASLGGAPAPVIDGLTGDQRFFLGFAQAFRGKQREASMRDQIASDPHTPWTWRVLGVVRNVDAWYTAFDVKPGDAMYLPPEQRARIW
ncbi:M13 family metallopeptidase [soil metagenome]